MPDSNISRRNILKAGMLAAAAAAVPFAGALAGNETPVVAAGPASAPAIGYDKFRGLKVGVATYTFRQRPLQPTIDGIRRVGLAYCSIKDMHLPLKTTAEQRKEVADEFRAAGITPLSCGVITIRSENDARQAFDYARDAGIPTIVAAPSRDVLPALDKLVKEYDIRIAIHNHGPTDKIFPAPADIMDAINDLDPRVGLCVDVGHTARIGVDPADSIRKFAKRVYDIHMKDVDMTTPKGKPVEVGRGVMDIKSIIAALIDIKFEGHVGFEYEKDGTDPLPGLAESVGYVRGLIAGMPA